MTPALLIEIRIIKYFLKNNIEEVLKKEININKLTTRRKQHEHTSLLDNLLSIYLEIYPNIFRDKVSVDNL